jgi:hypothetical protein
VLQLLEILEPSNQCDAYCHIYFCLIVERQSSQKGAYETRRKPVPTGRKGHTLTGKDDAPLPFLDGESQGGHPKEDEKKKRRISR